MNLFTKFSIACLLSVVSPLILANDVPSSDSAIISHFQEKLNKINVFMRSSHSKVEAQPELLVKFVDDELLEVWSAKNTIRAMMGAKRWKKLSETESQQVITAYENTIRRYLFELMQQYQGQQAEAVDLRLNSKGNKGWLTVTLESSNLPNIDVDLKIYRDDAAWTVYDFSFQGISFVKMKSRFFRGTFDRSGAKGVVKSLNDKNQEFNKILMASNDEQ